MYEPKPLTAEETKKLWLRTRKKVPYDEIAKLLLEGFHVFVPEMGKKTAYTVRKNLEKMIGGEVLSFPAEFEGKAGYVFILSLIYKLEKTKTQKS
jgi:hypothetical protein